MFDYVNPNSMSTISDSLILAVQGVTSHKKKNSKYAPKSVLKEAVEVPSESDPELCPKCQLCPNHCKCNKQESLDEENETGNSEDMKLLKKSDEELAQIDQSYANENESDEDNIAESYVHNNPLMESVYKIMNEAEGDVESTDTSPNTSSAEADVQKVKYAKYDKPRAKRDFPLEKTRKRVEGETKLPANGIELWRGPSPINGEELVCIATIHGDNVKTGDVIQTWILVAAMDPLAAMKQGLDISCCGSCEFRSAHSGGSNVCYVEAKNAPLGIWRAWKRGRYPQYNEKEYGYLFDGRTLRMGSYGDPALVELSIWTDLLKHASKSVGYTHQWRYKFAQPYKNILMASTESDESYLEAKKLGWRSFRAKIPGAALQPNERECPSETSDGKVKCNKCTACSGTGGNPNKRDITITAHGKAGQKFVRLSHSGKFLNSPADVSKGRAPLATSESIIHKLQESFNTDPTVEQMRASWLAPEAKQIGADEFDIEAAIYWFASDWHGGQNSNLYSALSTSEFTPGQNSGSVESEGELASMLYDELEAKTGLHSDAQEE